MIVGSTALPEQVAADVIMSSFDSAGQRCSALRVLCLQEEIVDHFLAMLRGEMQELRIGNTEDVRQDVGPVIDEGARAGLEAHVGNLYVNRNIIGAVVGVQPFGGEGLSGTGPKAGGPLYLHRLLRRSPGPNPRRFTRPKVAPAFAAMAGWLESGARSLLDGDTVANLRDRPDAYRTARLANLALSLPGPTGEDNSIRFVPRGRVAAIESVLRRQL